MADPRCHVCGCTQNDACPGGCEWATSATGKPLCSVCRYAAELLAEWMELCRRANITALVRETKAIFETEAVLVTKKRRRRT